MNERMDRIDSQILARSEKALKGFLQKIEEAFLKRLEEDRTRGFLRAAAWAATQEVAGSSTNSDNNADDAEIVDAGVPGHPSL